MEAPSQLADRQGLLDAFLLDNQELEELNAGLAAFQPRSEPDRQEPPRGRVLSDEDIEAHGGWQDAFITQPRKWPRRPGKEAAFPWW
ncbi:MAG: hypothetical protein IH988_00235 [Planctomycetes bacterium]|nr:hypothetical protein [Planctomycetota bacterium]